MQITVKLLGWMREYLREGIPPFDEQVFDLRDGESAGDLVARFGFANETPFMAMLNGERIPDHALTQTVLHEGDEIVFVPPLKGG